jgi:type II secretory pathway predicted ATPase ExeA
VTGNEHFQSTSHPPLYAALGLDRQPARPLQREKFFFTSPLTSQRLSVLHRLVNSRSPIIVIIGEEGSGKTTLMNRLIHDGRNAWSVCRIRLKHKHKKPKDRCQNLNNRLVFLTQKEGPPSVIIDDAHQLSRQELQLLIQSSFSGDAGSPGKFRNIMLFAQPRIRSRLVDMATWLPPNSAIEKIYMTPLTVRQTADYLRHRVKMAGFGDTDLFTVDQIRMIHRQSGGLPGWINEEACRLLQVRDRPRTVPLILRQTLNMEFLKERLWGRLPRIFKH